MSGRYDILAAARRDLIRQYRHLLADSPTAALKLFTSAHETFAFLAASPGAGHLLEHSRHRRLELRVWSIDSFPNHLAIYRRTRGGIEVVRVIHGAQDIGRLRIG